MYKEENNKDKLKISIVTPSYNQGNFIEKTIKSILNQNYENFEHIIIDGGSTDNTIEIVKCYKHLKWISEEDSGQANALNKGFALATGDIFAWLNSDDYYEVNIFNTVSEYFENHSDCDFLYGDITYVNKYDEKLFEISGDEINYNSLLKNPDLIRQPSFFWRREIFYKFGGIDESLNLVMDYDLFLKFTKIKKPCYIKKNFSYYRIYDETKTHSNRKKQAIEILKVMIKNKPLLSFSMLWFIVKRYFGSYSIFRKIRKIQKKYFYYAIK